jgi:hypothetical protein
MFNKASQQLRPAKWRRRMQKRFMDLDGGLHSAGGHNRTELSELEALAQHFAKVRDGYRSTKGRIRLSNKLDTKTRRKPRMFGQRLP